MLPVPGDFMIPRLVSFGSAGIVRWNSSRDSSIRVVKPMAPWVLLSFLQMCRIFRVYEQIRTLLPRAKAVIYSSAEAT